MLARLSLIAVLASLLIATPAGAITGRPVPALPRDFSWGVASSAYQSEGGFTNSNWDIYNADPTERQDPYGTSVDFRHRYKQDIALAKALGVTQYRFGINWARVEPQPGKFDQTELAYYDDVLKTIEDAGMVPQPTLDHWVYPKWVYDQDAWNNPKTVTDWLRYAEMMGERWKGRGARWLTFNEAFFYIVVEQARKKTVNPVVMGQNLVKAHNAFYDFEHRIDPRAQVSSNIVWIADAVPVHSVSDALFLDGAKGHMDFIGFDYYYESVGDAGLANILLGTPFDTPQYPQGIYVALHDLAAKFPGKPIYVSENGMPTDDGKPRADGWTRSRSLSDTVYWVQRAWADGVDVRGYQYWSLTDNFEFGDYGPRFGLYTVDVLTDKTLTRRPTDAVATYRDIIARRGVARDYRPTLIRCSDSGRALTCPDAPDPPRRRPGPPPAPPRGRPPPPPAALPVRLRVGLSARRSGGRRVLTAAVRVTGTSGVRVALKRSGRTVAKRSTTAKAGRATVRFTVRRGGRYAVRVTAGAASATSRTVVLAGR